MAIKELFEQNTDVVELATSLLAELSDREGQYVWKKSRPIIRLPEGYTELEYIETTGTQYIDTGFYPNQDTRVVVDVDTANSKTLSFPAIFSTSSLGSNKQRFVLMLYNEQTGFHDHYGGTAINSSNLNMYGRHIIDKNKNITYLDGNTVSTFTYSAFQSTVSLNLFASNDGSMQYYAKVKMYSCKVYDNDVLVKDFVPCKSASGAVGLYDIVNAKFYPNNGTGTFTAGEEYTYREFVCLTVADAEDAYPKNGMSGNYYYELIGHETEDEEETESALTGIDMGEFTTSSETSSITVPTRLTATPTAFLIYTKSGNGGEYKLGMWFATDHDVSAAYGLYGARTENSSSSVSSKVSTYVSYANGNITYTFTATNLGGGKTYRWVAIA